MCEVIRLLECFRYWVLRLRNCVRRDAEGYRHHGGSAPHSGAGEAIAASGNGERNHKKG